MCVLEYHLLEDVSTTLQKNETHIMDNRSRIAVIRTGNAFPDDIAGKYYVLESHLGSGLLHLNTSWGGSVIDREETAEKKAIIEQYYPFGDPSLRTFSKKRFRYVGKEGQRKIGLGDLFFLNEPAYALAKVGSIITEHAAYAA